LTGSGEKVNHQKKHKNNCRNQERDKIFIP